MTDSDEGLSSFSNIATLGMGLTPPPPPGRQWLLKYAQTGNGI